MRQINLSIAEPIGDTHPQPVTIIINDKIPKTETLDEAREFYTMQASVLARSLFNALPQGTRHRLLIELIQLEAQNSLFRGI